MLPLIDEVNSFCREYVNNPNERSPERNEKIRTAYKEVTGKNVRSSCGTCLIEAILEIFKKTEMGVCNYHLIDRPGHTGRLQAFGDFSKNCTNKNLTNELAEWHLRLNPACAKRFDRMPSNAPVETAGVKIIQPRIEKIIEPQVIKPIVEPNKVRAQVNKDKFKERTHRTHKTKK